MVDEPKSQLTAISTDGAENTSAIAINGKIVQKLDHNAAQPKAPWQPRKVKFANPSAFAGPKLKVERAKKHIAELEAALVAFNQTQPYSLLINKDPETGEDVWRISVDQPMPAEFSAIIGDIVHNLRAALDYIVCDLVRANNLIVPSADRVDPNTSGFPIAKTAKGNKAGKSGKIKGISDKAQRLVTRLKHHKGWNDQAWRLHFMDIFDKHNLVVTVGAATVHVIVQIAMPFFFQGPNGELLIGGPGEDGVPIMTAPGVPIGFKQVFPLEHGTEVHRSDPTIHNNVQVSVEVAFGKGEIAEGEPVLVALKQFAELAERTIKIFESVF